MKLVAAIIETLWGVPLPVEHVLPLAAALSEQLYRLVRWSGSALIGKAAELERWPHRADPTGMNGLDPSLRAPAMPKRTFGIRLR